MNRPNAPPRANPMPPDIIALTGQLSIADCIYQYSVFVLARCNEGGTYGLFENSLLLGLAGGSTSTAGSGAREGKGHVL